MFQINPLTCTDSYMFSHWKMVTPGTEYMHFYLEARTHKQVMFYGLAHILARLEEGFTFQNLLKVKALIDQHMGPHVFNTKSFHHLLTKYQGWPVIIKAAPEGLIIPGNNVLLTIENTDPEFYWVPGFLETQLLQVWYPCTVGTISHSIKQTIARYLHDTGNIGLLPYKLHDFGLRGATCMEQGAIGGSAHLVSFQGTDTVPALDFVKYYYGEPCAGKSIPAAAHHSVTAWGKDRELEAYRHILKEFPTGPLAIVSDSYNIFKACKEHFGTTLHDEVLNRDGFLVIRPDSGQPVTILGLLLPVLAEKFGVTINAKGYKVLNSKISVIWGDGLTPDLIHLILLRLKETGWSADNITFGMGGALLQKVDRGTYDFAMKCSARCVNGQWEDVFKDPITDPGKQSKQGRLMLVHPQPFYKYKNEYSTVKLSPHVNQSNPILQTVFHNGTITKHYTFDEIRRNASETAIQSAGNEGDDS